MNLNYYVKTSPVSSNCVNKVMVPLDNPYVTNSVFHLSYYDGLNTTLLFETWNGTNKLSSNIYSDQNNLNMDPSMDYNGNIYFARGHYFEKYDPYGSKLYHKTTPISPFTITTLSTKMDQLFFFDYAQMKWIVVFP